MNTIIMPKETDEKKNNRQYVVHAFFYHFLANKNPNFLNSKPHVKRKKKNVHFVCLS